jgi:DNA-binding SARP family transcriptional activator
VDSFLRQVEDGRTEQVARAVEAIREAEAHDAAHDYLSAIFTLESVPDSLRGAVLPDTRETVANALRRLKRKQAEIKRLEMLLKKRIKEQSLDGLLSEVESLLALEPNRKDIQRIRVQLLEREAKLAAARDEALKAASARMESYDYEGALAVLDTIAPAFVTSEVVMLREKAGSSIREAKRLKESIEQAVESKQFDGLIEQVDAYLRLKPHDDDAKKKLRQALLDREGKIAAEKQRLRHIQALRDLRDQIVAAVAKERFDGLLEKVEVYLQLQPNDPAGQSLLQRLQQLQQERQEDLSRMSKRIPRVLATKEWFLAIDLIAHRGWWRSEQVVFDELLCAVKERHAQSEAALSKRRIVALAGAVVAGICLVMMIMAGRRGESLDYYAVPLWGFLSSIVAIAGASSETSAFVADCGERIRELELRGCGEVG